MELFTLPPAASKRAHFPTSLLTSSLIKHYILCLFNPELLFLFMLSKAAISGSRNWKRQSLGKTPDWELPSFPASTKPQRLWFPRVSRRSFFANLFALVFDKKSVTGWEETNELTLKKNLGWFLSSYIMKCLSPKELGGFLLVDLKIHRQVIP